MAFMIPDSSVASETGNPKEARKLSSIPEEDKAAADGSALNASGYQSEVTAETAKYEDVFLGNSRNDGKIANSSEGPEESLLVANGSPANYGATNGHAKADQESYSPILFVFAY